MGILIASSSQVVYGHVIWDPIEHLGRFLDGNPSHGTRFGVAVIAICFVYVQLILNLSANSIGAGCDMTALCESRDVCLVREWLMQADERNHMLAAIQFLDISTFEGAHSCGLN